MDMGKKKNCFFFVERWRWEKSSYLTTEAQFLPASLSNKTLVYLCMHTCLHISTLCISENFCSFEWGAEWERRNVTVSVLMWNPFHVKFSFSDDNFSKPTANLEMFLISLFTLLHDRGIKRQRDESDWGRVCGIFSWNLESEWSD